MLYGLCIKVIASEIQRLFKMLLFLCSTFESISSPAIIHALITDVVKPVINMNIIKNIPLIALIFDFEAFSLERQVVNPIIIKPDVCSRYC